MGLLAGSADAEAVLDLQRSAGNRAVAGVLARRDGGPEATVRLPRVSGVEHPVAASLARPDVRGRVPTFADLKAVYQDKELRIPESVVKTAVTQLLGRMAREKRLKSADSVAAIVARIFPAPGVISEAEFTKALDVADRTAIYRSVLDADTTVRQADRAKLRAAMKAAAALIRSIEGDDVGLKAVFGAEYNLDDPEVSLGGWASHGARHMHLLVEIVKVIDAKESKITLIHEAAHLADPSVDDHGYYGTPNFEALGEDVKVGNAGHYEELPRRKLGTSSYAGLTFTPGVLNGGGAVTWEDTIRRESSEYLRKAWDAAVDTHTWLRGVRRAFLRLDRRPFEDQRALILEVSQLMDLTVHRQLPAKARITPLDVTLTESIARGVGLDARKRK